MRDRLQSQSQLIAGLKCTVNWFQELRKSGKPGSAPQLTSNLMEKLASALRSVPVLEDSAQSRTQQEGIVRVDGEAKGTRAVRGKDAKAGEAVNAASHHRDEDKAASPSAAPGKASQKEVDVMLKLLSPVRKERGAKDERGGRSLQSATNIASLVGTEFVNSSVVTAYLNALKCVNEVCAEARSLNNNNSSDPVELPKQIKEIQPISKKNVSVTNNEKTNVSAGKEPASKFKYTCSQEGCSSRVQVNGLCYRHGGYYTCREDGCDRKAITRQLCRLHGGGSLCHVPHCTKLIVSGGKGFCATHARNKGALAKYKCKVQGCTKTQVSQGFCHRHNAESKVGQARAPPTPGKLTSSSNLARIPRGHHETCKVIGCMKWVKRDGDASEFCDKHRHVFTTQEPKDGLIPDATTTRHNLCKEPECTNHAKNYGPKKGYCFRHGGGLPCTQPNCNKQRQRNGLCAAHGGYYECKVEGCKKRAAARGFCRSHCQESLSVSKSDREL